MGVSQKFVSKDSGRTLIKVTFSMGLKGLAGFGHLGKYEKGIVGGRYGKVCNRNGKK